GRQIDAGHALRQLLTDPGTDQLLEVVGGCGAAGLPHALEPLFQEAGGDGRGGDRIGMAGDGDVVHGASWLDGPCTTSWEARDAGPLRPAPLHSTGIPAGSAIETIGARRNRRRQAESSAPDGTRGARRSRRRQAEPAEPGGVVGARRNRRSQAEPAASGGTGGARRNRPRQATPPRALGDLRIRNSPNARGLGTGTRTPRTA